MNKPADLPIARIDFNDEDSNTSPNPTFDSILQTRLSRRRIMGGGVASAATVVLGSFGLSACSSGSDAVPGPSALPLAFTPVPKALADVVTVPTGYKASVIYALGDPLDAATAAYRNDGTDTAYENRAGDHHDGMEWFGLDASGRPSATANDRGLLGINHEATTDEAKSSFFLHANGGTSTLPRPAAEIDKELMIHGVSVVEVRRSATGDWGYVRDSAFNTRYTTMTPMEISGPARGHPQLVTKYSLDGTRTRGTLNNCGTGKTPWGTLLTGEENWFGYFFRNATDDTARGSDKSVTSLRRYGRNAGAASRHGWESGGAADPYARWNISKLGTSTDGSDDYRNEMNGQGYVVEIDPYSKSTTGRKRTALGRMAHESAAFGKLEAGKPVAVYMGCDARNEYIYKFVSAANWSAADASPLDRMATGSKYLDSGKLYVAKFNADGTGQWIELAMSNPQIAGYSAYAFTDAGDIAIHTRLAADAVGATKMDRPEWCAVNPANGEIYFTLTNNSNRRVSPSTSTQLAPDSANPRVYTDMKGTTSQQGNPNGHILRLKEGAAGNTATMFTWDVYLFGAQADAPAATVNLSNLTGDQDFSSPDGLVFSQATGLLWIQTDDGAYTDVTNCMMLVGRPGMVGDGAKRTLTYPRSGLADLVVDTYVGKAPTADTLKRFLVGPKGAEITGCCETPDGKALFINIQHPGENTLQADIADPSKYESRWPANAGYGAGSRPRSATVVITKNDGGTIGT